MRKILGGLVALLWATAAFGQVNPIPILTGPQDLGNVINSLNQVINKVNAFRGLQFVQSLQANSSNNLLFGPLPTAYNTFFLTCDGIAPVTNGQIFQLQYVENGSIKTTSYNYQNLVTLDNTAAFNPQVNTGDSGINLGTVDVTGSQANASVKLWISNVLSTASFKAITGQSQYQTTGPHQANTLIGGTYTGDNGQITGFNMKFATNGILQGTCTVFGLSQ